jgi:hypothetical protein
MHHVFFLAPFFFLFTCCLYRDNFWSLSSSSSSAAVLFLNAAAKTINLNKILIDSYSKQTKTFSFFIGRTPVCEFAIAASLGTLLAFCIA